MNVIRTPVSLNEMGADLSLTVGDFGRQDVKVSQLPIMKIHLSKVFVASIQHDGHVYNTTLKTDVGGDDKLNYGFALRAK